MTPFKTTAYIETSEGKLQQVVDAILGKDLSAWVCDYPFGTDGPEIIALEGNLGAGKTTLTKCLCAAWGCEQDVSSPTFSLVNEHTLPNYNGKLYHHDWYRVKDAGELFDAGIEEILHEYPSKHLVEWPEIGEFFSARFGRKLQSQSIVGEHRTQRKYPGIPTANIKSSKPLKFRRNQRSEFFHRHRHHPESHIRSG